MRQPVYHRNLHRFPPGASLPRLRLEKRYTVCETTVCVGVSTAPLEGGDVSPHIHTHTHTVTHCDTLPVLEPRAGGSEPRVEGRVRPNRAYSSMRHQRIGGLSIAFVVETHTTQHTRRCTVYLVEQCGSGVCGGVGPHNRERAGHWAPYCQNKEAMR